MIIACVAAFYVLIVMGTAFEIREHVESEGEYITWVEAFCHAALWPLVLVNSLFFK